MLKSKSLKGGKVTIGKILKLWEKRNCWDKGKAELKSCEH